MMANGLATSLSGLASTSSLGKAAKSSPSVLGPNDFQKILASNLSLQSALSMRNPNAVAELGAHNRDAGISDVLLLQSLNNGANLIGKSIAYEKAGSSVPAKGRV